MLCRRGDGRNIYRILININLHRIGRWVIWSSEGMHVTCFCDEIINQSERWDRRREVGNEETWINNNQVKRPVSFYIFIPPGLLHYNICVTLHFSKEHIFSFSQRMLDSRSYILFYNINFPFYLRSTCVSWGQQR